LKFSRDPEEAISILTQSGMIEDNPQAIANVLLTTEGTLLPLIKRLKQGKTGPIFWLAQR
jgi:hypothetical protein